MPWTHAYPGAIIVPDSSILSVKDLVVAFPGVSGEGVQVVRGCSFSIGRGKTLGIVGESGCGKSITALSILGLVPIPGIIQGSIKYQGQELVGLEEKECEKLRGAEISIVFQDPSTALNPVFNLEQQLVETILRHKNIGSREACDMAIESLKQVDIPDPQKRIKDYPHQLSGGMKQRVLIAMALLCDPSCLILDEPTTALDVTVQAQILDLIELIQRSKNMSIILISHDLGIISEISDEIAIMYAGRIVETTCPSEIINSHRHPYTKGLIESIPKIDSKKKKLKTISGFPPDPQEMPSGCPFHPRCTRRLEKCVKLMPPKTLVNDNMSYACWNPV
ncbi:ABC transporter ATP-binding protein [bacterium]|nr:ABC transporter ATP-binding protein [bacterium]